MRFIFSPHNPTLNSKRSWNFVFSNSKPPTYLEFILLLECEIENKCACFVHCTCMIIKCNIILKCPFKRIC